MEKGRAWTETLEFLRTSIFILNTLAISKNSMTYLKQRNVCFIISWSKLIPEEPESYKREDSMYRIRQL